MKLMKTLNSNISETEDRKRLKFLQHLQVTRSFEFSMDNHGFNFEPNNFSMCLNSHLRAELCSN